MRKQAADTLARCINLFILECKNYRASIYAQLFPVLIFSYWNVKGRSPHKDAQALRVLIFSYWNVK